MMKASARDELIQLLEARFEKNPQRHSGIKWTQVRRKLETNPDALRTLQAMAASGGEPDAIGRTRETAK